LDPLGRAGRCGRQRPAQVRILPLEALQDGVGALQIGPAPLGPHPNVLVEVLHIGRIAAGVMIVLRIRLITPWSSRSARTCDRPQRATQR
jgi:hypothetical protein